MLEEEGKCGAFYEMPSDEMAESESERALPSLEEEGELFQSVKSLEYVCYCASESGDETLQRLLRELPEAGVTLIGLDEGEQCVFGGLPTRAVEQNDEGADQAAIRRVHLSPCPETTLLLAGSAATLALAAGTPMATVGYGRLAEKMFGWDGTDADVCTDEDGVRSVCAASGVQADIIVEGFDEVDVQFLDRIMKRAQGLPWITVVTGRCYLREMTLDDLDDLFALYAQPGITDYTEPLYERPQEEQYTRDYIENMYRFYGYGMWLVCDRESGALIGRAGFSHQDLGDEIVLEMGYIIGVPWQRQGYATEVCEKLLAFARTNLADFGTINCFVEPGNTASHGLMGKLAFDRAGTVTIGGKRMIRYELEL